MSSSGLPANYLAYNTQQSKNVVVVVKIAGVPDVICNQGLYTRILYGDPGIVYGESGLVYGGVRPYIVINPDGSTSTFRPYISEHAALTLQQKLETEQGKSSVSTISIDIIDYEGYMTEICSPGMVIPDIMGAECEIWLGFQQISYPQDFFRVFRGYISQVTDGPGNVTIQLSDPQLKTRTSLFPIQQTTLQNDIDSPNYTLYNGYGVNYLCDGATANLVTIQQVVGGSTSVVANGNALLVTILSSTTAAQLVTLVNASSAAQGLGVVAYLNALVSTTVQVAMAASFMSPIGAYNNVVTTAGNAGFFQPIEGPDGTYDDSVTCYLSVDSEFISAVPIPANDVYGLYAQGLTYQCTGSNASLVTIQYTGGGTAGAEVVLVSGNSVLVQIQVGVSTNVNINNAINASSGCAALGLTATVYVPLSGTPQVAMSQQYLSLGQTVFVAQGFLFQTFTNAEQSTTPFTLQFLSDTTAGSEYVTFTNTGIIVSMQDSVSTLAQIWTALEAVAPNVLPHIVISQIQNQGTVTDLVGDDLTEALVAYAFPTTAFVAGTNGSQFAVIARAQQGISQEPAALSGHSAGSTVSAAIQIGDDVNTENAIDMALKVMLSGWDGPWISDVAISAITPAGFVLPNLTDAVINYGLVIGDYVTCSGSGSAGNNETFVITGFLDNNGQTNQIIQVDGTLTGETSSPALLAFRSQYDVYPVDAGLALTPLDVDIAQHLYIKRVFLGTPGNDLRFLFTSAVDSAKDWIGTQIYFPVGAYPVTRRGQLSVGYNKPPIADQSLTVLDESNVLNADQIMVIRALNNRTFFNEIDISYDPDSQGNYQQIKNVVDSDSLTTIGVNTILPINADGVRYSAYVDQLLTQRAGFYLQRFGNGAVTFTVDVNWETGSVLEAGDVVTFDDGGTLNIANFTTGSRGIDNQLFEIVGRSFDMMKGRVTLDLLGGVGASALDRFATISPSSKLVAGSTASAIIIQDSFGALYPGQEWRKWLNYVGMQVQVHSQDYSVSGLATLVSISNANPYVLNLSGLGFTPAAGYILDIAPYPNSTNKNTNAYEKLIHAFLDPSVSVVSGINATSFNVASGDESKFMAGYAIRIHNADYSLDSGDLTIKTISGTLITVSSSMGFVPTSACICDLLGFPDGGYAYRWI